MVNEVKTHVINKYLIINTSAYYNTAEALYLPVVFVVKKLYNLMYSSFSGMQESLKKKKGKTKHDRYII